MSLLVNTQMLIIALAVFAAFASASKCKSQKKQHRTRHNNAKGRTRILHGTASKANWPFMVSIQYNGQHICGGTLLEPDVVLTAGHCLMPKGLEVVAGNNRLPEYFEKLKEEESDQYQRIAVGKFERHPDYSEFGGVRNDLALLLLEKPVKIVEKRVNMVQLLPEKNEELPSTDDGVNCMIMGWGLLNKKQYAKVLMEASVNVINREVCSNELHYNGTVELSKNVFCAGKPSRKNPCRIQTASHADSGGPVVCNTDGKWKQVGVLSMGLDNLPAIYTKLANYIDFLEESVPKMRKLWKNTLKLREMMSGLLNSQPIH